jgi:hypothetical protein
MFPIVPTTINLDSTKESYAISEKLVVERKDVGIVCRMYRRFDERLLMVSGYGGVASQAISTI